MNEELNNLRKRPEYHLIKAMLIEGKRKAHRLDGGLALAYWVDDGAHVLTMSREGRELSASDVKIVTKCLHRILEERGNALHPKYPIEPVKERDGEHFLARFRWETKVVKIDELYEDEYQVKERS